jgi:hypothetical protein
MDKIERQPRTGEEQPGKKVYPDDMRITMAIPFRDIVHGIPGISRYTLSKFEEMCETTAKAGYEVNVITNISTSNTPVTRTRIVNAFKGDWLLMMDADAFPEGDTVNKLLLAAKEDPENLRKIVCVPSVRPSYPHFCTFGRIKDNGQMVPWRYTIEFDDKELDATETCVREVDGSGFHCVLIHRSVFDVVSFPWFPLQVPDPETGVIYGHDYSFCRAAKRLGDIKTYVDFSCRVGHMGIMPFTLQNNAMIIKSNPAEADRQKHFDIDVDSVDVIEEPEENADHMMNMPMPKRGEAVIPESMILPVDAVEDKGAE